MQINLWFNVAMGQWRWTLTDPETLNMESGQRENLREAMGDVATTVEYLISQKS
jgi:hypothetical protein